MTEPAATALALPPDTHATSAQSAKMEHSSAIMQDAGKAIDGSARNENESNKAEGSRRGGQQNNCSQRKRKGEFSNAGRNQGSRGRGGGRGGHHDDNKRHKKGDMGRGEYLYVARGQTITVLAKSPAELLLYAMQQPLTNFQRLPTRQASEDERLPRKARRRQRTAIRHSILERRD